MGSYDRPTRREFLKTAGAGLAIPYVITSTALGNADVPPASERIVMGGIGIGNMGRGDQGAFLGRPDVQYVAVCDVRGGVRDAAKKKVDEHYKNTDCKAYNDFRECSPHRYRRGPRGNARSLACDLVIEACRAARLSRQKPNAHLAEGPEVEAARRYARVVSGGSQRVLEDYRKTVDPCWSGELGELKWINVNVGPLSQPCNLPAEPVPADMDWEMWLGPAPWAPYNKARCDGNFGTSGGSWVYSTIRAAHDRLGRAPLRRGNVRRDVRECSPKRSLQQGGRRGVWRTAIQRFAALHNRRTPATAGRRHAGRQPPQKAVPSYKGHRRHLWRFIECVKTVKDLPRHRLAVNTDASHLGITAYTLKRSLKWDRGKQEFPGDDEANRLLDPARREPWQL